MAAQSQPWLGRAFTDVLIWSVDHQLHNAITKRKGNTQDNTPPRQTTCVSNAIAVHNRYVDIHRVSAITPYLSRDEIVKLLTFQYTRNETGGRLMSS
jgi:hypothetical protein